MPLGRIIGHTRLIALLRHAVARGRVPQSLLLAGPEGVGKRAVAIALAQAINCPNRKEGDACGRCATCLRIASGTHSDVAIIDLAGEASIKIKRVRERVLETIGYRPFEAPKRVYIIEPADTLTWEAQDALLKTLEEPPVSAVIMLVTAYPDTLRPTVLSRCRRLRFGALAEEEVVRILIEHEKIDPSRARALAAVSGGSVASALAVEEGNLEDDRQAALGLLRAARTGAVVARLKASAALGQHGSKRRDRDALGTRLAIIQTLLRDLGVLAAGGTTPLANGDLETPLRELSSAFDASRLIAGFALLTRAQLDLDRYASPKIVADVVAVSL